MSNNSEIFLNSLFWFTGAFVWFVVAALFFGLICLALWRLLGEIVFMFKIAKHKNFKNKEGKRFSFSDYLDQFKSQIVTPSAIYEDPNTGQHVWFPWPWLSTKLRKEIENDWKNTEEEWERFANE